MVKGVVSVWSGGESRVGPPADAGAGGGTCSVQHHKLSTLHATAQFLTTWYRAPKTRHSYIFSLVIWPYSYLT